MFFGSQKSHFLGIDFGTSLIKAVELTVENGTPRLVNYGQVDLTSLEKGKIPAEHTYDGEVSLYLRALLERFHPKSKSAYVAIPSFTGLFSLIELPEMKEEELEQAVRFEAHKYIPSALEDVVLSWEIVGNQPATEEDGAGKLEILLVAALTKEVERYRQYLVDAQLKMEFLELETFSLVRAVVGNEPGIRLVIDMGSRTTNLVLAEDGLVKMSRNIDAGGSDITRTLVDGLNITLARAEILKKSEKDFLSVPESALVFPTLELIASEAERMLTSFKTKYPDKEFSGIILSGGMAQMAGLLVYFSKIFQLPVSIADPWSHITYDVNLKPKIDQLGTSFSVALGLALAGIEGLEPKKESFKKPFSLRELLTKKL